MVVMGYPCKQPLRLINVAVVLLDVNTLLPVVNLRKYAFPQ